MDTIDVQFDLKMVDSTIQFLQFLTTSCFFFLAAMGGVLSYCWLREQFYNRWWLALGAFAYAMVIALLVIISSTYRLTFESLVKRGVNPLVKHILNKTDLWVGSVSFGFPMAALAILVVALVLFFLALTLSS